MFLLENPEHYLPMHDQICCAAVVAHVYRVSALSGRRVPVPTPLAPYISELQGIVRIAEVINRLSDRHEVAEDRIGAALDEVCHHLFPLQDAEMAPWSEAEQALSLAFLLGIEEAAMQPAEPHAEHIAIESQIVLLRFG